MKQLPQQIDRILAEVLRDRDAVPHVLVGPVVWQEAGGSRAWHFVIDSGDRAGLFIIQVKAGADPNFTDEIRAAVIAALVERRQIVVHDIADESEMARRAEAIWPGEKTRAIRAAIEAERAETGPARATRRRG